VIVDSCGRACPKRKIVFFAADSVILSISKGVTAFLLAKSYKTSHDLSMIMTTRSSRSVHRSLARTLLFISFVAVCLALFQTSQAVSPPPDGGYPGGNTAEGQDAVLSLTSGTYNTAIGIYSLLSLTDGDFCTGVGAGTLLANTGDNNTATGAGALLSNTEGSFNTATGAFALFGNTTGSVNTATGYNALQDNTTGTYNTATGYLALASNTDGDANTATGYRALHDNFTGIQNIAIGYTPATTSRATAMSASAQTSLGRLQQTTPPGSAM
jgi:hypothetical protein